MRVQAFVAKLAVETLDVSVLHGPSWFNVVELHFLLLTPSAYALANKFRPVVYTNGSGQSTFFGEQLQDA
jgi:hypothetical protein